ncbi:hypothetical protein AaE_016275 [Aphanomyces astaci]|uniref:Tc1-like transposase DDE domain-containing protein n=1 Tax=Aphanomyces astaci TaxID=112090 RepID=A0A6A4YZE1_APHAT|nr:hypothetical protein AaE_016275 [Aphanomyces astaci]
MPFGHQFYADEILFQQDNASIHRAKTTMEFLKEQKVTVFDHPALSPDLNPIENLWGRIVRIVYSNGKQYDNVVDLKVAIKRAWAEIDDLTIKNLVDSMPRRCTSVIAMGGGMTKY